MTQVGDSRLTVTVSDARIDAAGRDITSIIYGFVGTVVFSSATSEVRLTEVPLLDLVREIEYWRDADPQADFDYDGVEGPEDPPLFIRRTGSNFDVESSAQQIKGISEEELRMALGTLSDQVGEAFERLALEPFAGWRSRHGA